MNFDISAQTLKSHGYQYGSFSRMLGEFKPLITDEVHGWCVGHDGKHDKIWEGGKEIGLDHYMGNWKTTGPDGKVVTGGLADHRYHMKVEVNRRLDGTDALKWITVTASEMDGAVKIRYEVDYHHIVAYQPDLTKTVRLGLNTCKADWTVWNLKAMYLDPSPPKKPAAEEKGTPAK